MHVYITSAAKTTLKEQAAAPRRETSLCFKKGHSCRTRAQLLSYFCGSSCARGSFALTAEERIHVG